MIKNRCFRRRSGIFRSFSILFLSLTCLSASELSIDIRANGLGTFVLADGKLAKNFIEARPSSQFSLEFTDANGTEYVRFLDKGATLRGPEDHLEVLTMSPLNIGQVEPGFERYTNAVLRVTSKKVDELFTEESLFGTPLEAERVAVVAATADAYLEDLEDRGVTKSASEVPLRFFSGEKMARDDKGRLPMVMKVKEILFGYPQSYDFNEALRQHAGAIKRVKPKPFLKTLSASPRAATPFARFGGSIRVKIVRSDGTVAEKYLGSADMRANAVPVIPPPPDSDRQYLPGTRVGTI